MIIWRSRTRLWSGYLVALLLTAAVTGVVALVRAVADVSNASMLYLLAVLACAIAFGIGPAVFASAAAFFAYDFFFVKPVYTITVNNSDEWFSLGLLLITGVITAQLAAAIRDRARDAERREREAIVLYDVVRLLNRPDLEAALTAIAERLRQEMNLSAVVIDLERAAPLLVRAEAGDAGGLETARAAGLPPASILSAGVTPTDSKRGAPGRWIRVVPPTLGATPAAARRERLYKVPVNVRGAAAGSLLLVRRRDAPLFRPEDDRLLSAVASQLGLAIERAQLTEEATQAEILRKTDELRTALLNAVSHDFRTPLSSIMAAAGSLLQEDISWTAEERSDFARAIQEEAGRLNRLVGNLLDLSRIEAGALRPDKGWYDLGALVDDVLGRLRPVTSRHHLVVQIPEDLPPVLIDYVEMDEVLSNLIENAARYTPPGTEITIAARCLDGELEIEVADRGPGIPVDALPRLFEPFYRPSQPGQPSGAGLGLAVARGLVAAHEGRIRAENRARGGTSFVITLPLGTVEEGARDPVWRPA